MNKHLTAIVDADYIKYTAASAGEKRTIIVTHRSSGRQKEFNTRTDFYGHWAKKSGGWLAEVNKERTSPFTVDEFDIEDVQTADPIENILHTTRLMWESGLAALGTSKYKGFVGKGECFRVERSTLIKYKENRADVLRPIHLEAVTDYLIKKFGCEVIEAYESDDVCVMESYKQPDKVVLGIDKDYYGQPVQFFNVNRPEEGIHNGDQFGKLWLNDKGDVRGVGRLFLYWQVGSGDKSDNYSANSASETKWADKGAYNALVNSANDREALINLVNIYKHLYPEPKKFKGWRGEEIDIDWLYVLSENFDLARMLRYENEALEIKDVLDKMKIEY